MRCAPASSVLQEEAAGDGLGVSTIGMGRADNGQLALLGALIRRPTGGHAESLRSIEWIDKIGWQQEAGGPCSGPPRAPRPLRRLIDIFMGVAEVEQFLELVVNTAWACICS